MADYRNRFFPRQHFLNVHGDPTFAVGLTIEQFGSSAHIALTVKQAEKLAAEILRFCKRFRATP